MIKTRIAPSPTGFLHIGTARTALFNWLYAKKMGGEFILRIEDTDLERSDKKYEKDITEGLKWLGLEWSYHYKQSERIDIYEKYLKQLIDSGKAFWCDHSKEELRQENSNQRAKKEASRHICSHEDKKLEKGQVLRLKINHNSKEKIIFDDIIRGPIEWEERLLGNLSLAKDLRTPLYNFTVVVDDIDMNISHVIRGEDHISNTPKQLLIYKTLQIAQLPIFAHIPLTLAPDRSKLSKRHGSVSINEYKKDYLPEAIINFMGFLGYTFSKEILSKEEMVQEFELEKMHKSGAIFDEKKLNWTNLNYTRNLNAKKFKSLINLNVPDKAIPLITERLEKLSDAQNFSYFWEEPSYNPELLKWKKGDLEESRKTLAEVKKIIEGFDFAKRKEELRQALDELSVKIGNRGLVYWPLRVALTGKEKSPDPVDIAFVLGKEKTLERISRVNN